MSAVASVCSSAEDDKFVITLASDHRIANMRDVQKSVSYQAHSRKSCPSRTRQIPYSSIAHKQAASVDATLPKNARGRRPRDSKINAKQEIANWLATSPPLAPSPSATMNNPFSLICMKKSSLMGRRRPISVEACREFHGRENFKNRFTCIS